MTVAMGSEEDGPELAVESETPETILAERSNRQLVQSAIDELPVHHREALLLCEVEEMSYQEIAEILSIPIGTVMSRLARARKAVRESLRRTGAAMVNPFDLKTVLLAKHAQHVVLIHFPIALFISAVGFDLIAHWTKRRGLADTAYYNLLVAAISTFPVLATGILAWQFQLEGQKLKGILLLHLVLACVSSVMIWLVWSLHFRARRRAEVLPSYRLAVEFLGVGIVALTGHLGGFLSGVNGVG
jgi:uncharacterized membrane protein/predicted DNA-binding protein (UPF0251 family)